MASIAAPAARWFIRPRPAPDADLLLFCLPYAGGGASAFRTWPAAFAGGDQRGKVAGGDQRGKVAGGDQRGECAGGDQRGNVAPEIEVCAVALPGREGRIVESPAIDVPALAVAVAAAVDRPFAVYGHSMGGKVGFELVRELRRSGAAMPIALVVGASRAPDELEAYLGRLSECDDDEMIARLTRLGGMPAGVLAEPELVAMLLPIFRADFAWLDAYEFVAEAPLPVPVIGLAGADDPAVSVSEMAGWTRHTSAGCQLTVLPGGHFFPAADLGRFAGLVRHRLHGVLVDAGQVRG